MAFILAAHNSPETRRIIERYRPISNDTEEEVEVEEEVEEEKEKDPESIKGRRTRGPAAPL